MPQSTKLKSTAIEPAYLDKKIKHLLAKLKFLQGSQKSLFYENIGPLIPQKHIERINYWFTEKNKNELGIISKREKGWKVYPIFLDIR